MTSGRLPIRSLDPAAPSARARPRWRAAVPGPAFAAAAAGALALLVAWPAFLLGGQRRLLLLHLALAAAVVALALSCEARERPSWRDALEGLRRRVALERRWLGAGAVLLAGGLAFRVLAWPRLMLDGDGLEYDAAGALAAANHGYAFVPWRTPGFEFTLSWIYGLAGGQRYHALHAFEIGLSLATAVLMAGIAYLATGRRWAALAALALGCFLEPLAAAAAQLMSEEQALFLATLAAFLAMAIHRGRAAGAAALALGPTAGLLYETRPPLLPWAAVACGVAVLLVRLEWRRRAVIVLGAALVLLPVAITNVQSPAHVLTTSAVLDVVPQALGTDRFSIYWNVPVSPEAMEAYREAILTDGGAANYWLDQPPDRWPPIMAARRAVMLASIRDHLGPYVELYLRRGPLMYRYDQPYDFTYGGGPVPWLPLLDALFLAALGGLAWLAVRRRWVPLVLLGGLVLSLTATLPLIHVEPRYSLSALPTVGALAAVGLVAGARWLARVRPPRPRRLALPATLTLVAGGLAAVVAAEAWAWPWLQDPSPPSPATGAHQLASCSPGPHMLASVAWRPGTSSVVVGGMNGIATWDVGARTCPWHEFDSNDVWDLAFARDGSRFALAAFQARVVDSRTLRERDAPAGGITLTAPGADALGVSFDPTGRWLAYTIPAYRRVALYDTATRSVGPRVSLPASPIAVRWSPDGSLLAVSDTTGLVRLYDPGLGPVQELRLDRPAGALAWSPAGDRLAAGDDAGAIHLWTVAGGRATPAASVAAHRAAVRGLAFSPDGTRLASASSDRLAIIWDAAGLRPVRRLAAHTAAVWSVAWSPDGGRVVTASADRSVKLWDAGR